MSSVVTTGRIATADFFRKSGLFDGIKLTHTPFLVFDETGSAVKVIIVDNVKGLLLWPDETKVMAQWHGQWRSDFFQFTVGEARTAVAQTTKKEHSRL